MNQTIGVNITPQSFQPTLHYSQGDVGRVFVVNVTDYSIPSGATVTCVATKPSGMGFTINGTVSGNSVTFTSTAEMTDEWGRFPAEIRIASGNTLLGTANFLMIGEKNPHPDSTIDGTQEELIPQLTLLVNRVEAAAESVHDLTVSATTLTAGSDATATYDSANNSIAFGIPRGADGDVTRSEFNDLKSDLSDTTEGFKKVFIDADSLTFYKELYEYSYSPNTGSWKIFNIDEFLANANTTYKFLWQTLENAPVPASALRIELYNGSTKITDYVFADSVNTAEVTTNASTTKIVVQAIISLGSAPASNGIYRLRNLFVYTDKIKISSAFDLVTVNDVKEAQEKVLNTIYRGDLLTSRKLDGLYIGSSQALVRPAGAGTTETYAFDIENLGDSATLIIKNNNATVLAVSDVAINDLALGSGLTVYYAYKIVDDEITIPNNVLSGHKTLLFSPSYRSSDTAIVNCIKGVSDSYLKRPPLVTFIDDDGFSESLTNWEALGKALGIRNTFALITGNVGVSANYATWADVQRLDCMGFDFISHTHGHIDMNSATPEEIEADALLTRAEMLEHGLKASFVAYPGGVVSDANIDTVASNYKAAIEGGGSKLNVTPLTPYNIVRSSVVSGTKTITVDGTTYTVNAPKTIAAIKAEFDKLIMNRGWLIFTSHFRNSYTDGYYYDTDFSDLIKAIVEYAGETSVNIKTFADGYEIFKNKIAEGSVGDASYYIVDCDDAVYSNI